MHKDSGLNICLWGDTSLWLSIHIQAQYYVLYNLVVEHPTGAKLLCLVSRMRIHAYKGKIASMSYPNLVQRGVLPLFRTIKKGPVTQQRVRHSIPLIPLHTILSGIC